MKTYGYLVCLFIVIGVFSAESQPAGDSNAQRYRKLFSGYREVVVHAVAGHTENRLADLTKEYFVKAGEHPILITVSRTDESGKRSVLLHSADAKDLTLLPSIHWTEPEDIHFKEGDNYILLETGQTKKGNYEDGLYITMGFSKSSKIYRSSNRLPVN